MFVDHRQQFPTGMQPPMGMQPMPMGTLQQPAGMQQMPMGTLQQPMEFHPQLSEQQGMMPQQSFPGSPGGGSWGGPGGGVSSISRRLERLERQLERLDRRVSRIERQLGYSRPDHYDLPDHPDGFY